MRKEIVTVNNVEFEFFFDERLNMWRTIENSNIIDGYHIDIEIDLKNQKESFYITEIISFMEYLKSNAEIVNRNVNDSKIVLRSLFQTLYKNIFSQEVLDNIDFNFVGIDYKGYSENYPEKFEYDLQFFPFYKKDQYRDIGAFLWKAFFRDKLLLGVYSDTQ